MQVPVHPMVPPRLAQLVPWCPKIPRRASCSLSAVIIEHPAQHLDAEEVARVQRLPVTFEKVRAGPLAVAGGAGTTSAGASGAASSSGSNAPGSGSNAMTSSSSGKSGSGCSFAPTDGTGAGWGSLAALAWLVRARRRPKRRFVATNAQRSAR
jgi:MYXO-CTERM domain-containing protein